MPKGVLFWVVYLICLIFSMYCYWPDTSAGGRWQPVGGSLAIFVMLGLLGWAVFGAPVQ